MNILFLHNNCPAQFHRLAVQLARDPNNNVYFLSRHQRADVKIPGVHHVSVATTNQATQTKEPEQLVSAERFAQAMIMLSKKGFSPDIVYAHAGFGCGYYAPDVFPKAIQISYFEWYYNNCADTQFFAKDKKPTLATVMQNRRRNIATLQALYDTKFGVCPTFWQYNQFPKEFFYKLHIIHDGVDTHFFAPVEGEKPNLNLKQLSLPSDCEIVTYAARGLELYRGFPTFYKSLPYVLQERPKAHIVIIGDDRPVYGSLPSAGKTWKELLQSEIPLPAERVHFLPFQNYTNYRSILQSSDLHVYLTAPFVLSWSMLEAMSMGVTLVASNTEPVREVISNGVNGILTDFWDAENLGKTIVQTLKDNKDLSEMRTQARNTILQNYALSKILPKHIALIKTAMESRD